MPPGGGLPRLAGASELERWADTRSAQADLPVLVRRLVRAENDQVQRVEVRGGDGVGLRGYDGFVEASRSAPFVPDGYSVWEMGVGVIRQSTPRMVAFASSSSWRSTPRRPPSLRRRAQLR